jgi:DNA-binding XRE family transcriptional regulator
MCTIALSIFFSFLYATKLVQIATNFVVFVVTNYNKIPMSLFLDNIKNLRVQHEISQEKLAESLGITRGRCIKYEDGWIHFRWAVY